MRLVIDIVNDHFNISDAVPENHSQMLVGVTTRVILNDEREYGIERKMLEDEFRSNFDIIWEEMGRKVKETIKAGQDDG